MLVCVVQWDMKLLEHGLTISEQLYYETSFMILLVPLPMQAWRFWHFHVISLDLRSQEPMKKFWSLPVLASRPSIQYSTR